MSYITMKQMLETGVHFGHQTRRWNPKMRPYIFGARKGIHIIDLQQTVKLFQTAHDFIGDLVARGGKIIFVGTKRQAQDSVQEEASRCDMFYVTKRWMGGTLTNFETISRRIDRLKQLEEMFEDGSINKFPKKEIVGMQRELDKLEAALGGIKHMDDLPQAAFIIDPKREDIAIKECRKLHIPIVAVTDTNCDPDLIDYIIPGNDDAIRAIKLFATHIAEACLEGQARLEEEEEQPSAEPEPAKAKAAKPAPAKKQAKPAPAPKPAAEAPAKEPVEEKATEPEPAAEEPAAEETAAAEEAPAAEEAADTESAEEKNVEEDV